MSSGSSPFDFFHASGTASPRAPTLTTAYYGNSGHWANLSGESSVVVDAKPPKNWRWFLVFLDVLEPLMPKGTVLVVAVPHRCQQLVDRADVAHKKRRAWLQRLAAS